MRLSLSKLLDLTLPKGERAERFAFLKAQPFAHRGLHGGAVVENSLSAFAAAVAAGHGIELDVQLAADGEAFVFHDERLERLTDEIGLVAERMGADLARVRLKGSLDTIPRLSDVLAMAAGRAPILIEIKADGINVNLICLAVRRALEGYQGDVGVMSFNPRVGKWFAAHATRLPRGLVMDERPADKRWDKIKAEAIARIALFHAKPDFIAYDIDYLASPLPQALRGRGLPLLTWTVRTAEQERRALSYADEIIYEKPRG